MSMQCGVSEAALGKRWKDKTGNLLPDWPYSGGGTVRKTYRCEKKTLGFGLRNSSQGWLIDWFINGIKIYWLMFDQYWLETSWYSLTGANSLSRMGWEAQYWGDGYRNQETQAARSSWGNLNWISEESGSKSQIGDKLNWETRSSWTVIQGSINWQASTESDFIQKYFHSERISSFCHKKYHI